MTSGPDAPFVHLRVHSAFSLLEGALPIPRLAHLAGADAMPALALTDRNNLFGALEFAETMAKAGIQPIIGCALTVELPEGDAPRNGALNGNDIGERPVPRSTGTLALLAQSKTGYKNLLQLSSRAFLDTEGAARSFVPFDLVDAHSDGLIALTGGPEGLVDRALAEGSQALAAERLQRLHGLFGDRLYVELQRHGEETERRVEPALLTLAYDQALPIVATNQAYFAEPGDFEAHDALLCISEGTYIATDDRRRLTPQHCFKSGAEMAALFADLPEAVANTAEIAMRCAYRPLQREPILPQSVKRTGVSEAELLADEAKELRRQAEAGLRRRLAEEGTAPEAGESDYWDRLETELTIITDMNYPGYFLIVADFIQWAKHHDIPVGPGRGSGAGSVVAWALTITDLDPIRFGLLFERFLNPERVSMPDFDIDFCQDRRDEVIRYVQEKYGHDHVAQIITFGKLQARAVLRDVGRVLQMPYGQVDRLCKLVPNNPADPVTLQQAIDGEPKLQDERDKQPLVARLLDIGRKLEGLYRHASTHAAGIVIGDRPLVRLVPLYRDPRAALAATQFNMKWVEAAGLVKFDFLGLKTLTVIEKAKQLLQERGVDIDPARLPLDDDATYALLSRADTVGVFQLESAGMRDALRKLKPDRFEDIIAMVALYRPGPMANIESFINRKHGRETVDYLDPLIQPVLEETYGIIIYQEQVMEIARILSGYSLGEADLLRRAMGKKIKKEMDQQKSRFVEGAVDNKVDRGRAEYIFELVARFAGYGFNKSHAAAYAMLAYQTAYLKANRPVEFLAASMTLDMGNTDKLGVFVQEARRFGIAVEPPSINRSEVEFASAQGGIRYALAALKTMGRAAAQSIVAERAANGRFSGIGDFARRTDPQALNKRGIEALAAAGAFDDLDADRAKLVANADRLLNKASSGADKAQVDMFGGASAGDPVYRPTEPWTPVEQMDREFEAVGLYISGHPLDQYEAALKRYRVESWSDFAGRASRGAQRGRLAGSVIRRQERRGRNGGKFAFIQFSDQTGQFEAIAFSDTLAAHGEALEPGAKVVVELEAEPDGESARARLLSVVCVLDSEADAAPAAIRVVLDSQEALAPVKEGLRGDGAGRVRLALRVDEIGKEIELSLPGRYDISPKRVGALQVISGVAAVEPLALEEDAA